MSGQTIVLAIIAIVLVIFLIICVLKGPVLLKYTKTIIYKLDLSRSQKISPGEAAELVRAAGEGSHTVHHVNSPLATEKKEG